MERLVPEKVRSGWLMEGASTASVVRAAIGEHGPIKDGARVAFAADETPLTMRRATLAVGCGSAPLAVGCRQAPLAIGRGWEPLAIRCRWAPLAIGCRVPPLATTGGYLGPGCRTPLGSDPWVPDPWVPDPMGSDPWVPDPLGPDPWVPDPWLTSLAMGHRVRTVAIDHGGGTITMGHRGDPVTMGHGGGPGPHDDGP